jgi:subtilisin family serine protease
MTASSPGATSSPCGPDAYGAALAGRHGFRVDRTYRRALRGFAADLSGATVAGLRLDPNVLRVEPDRIVRVTDETLPTGVDRIDAEPAGDINNTGPEKDIDIAVLDTGVDLSHPDLRVAGGMASYAEVIFIFLSCGHSDSFDDGHGHGTHVSGIAAARDNNFGVVGVAPGARIWAVRVLGPTGNGCGGRDLRRRRR